jgi:hypothetical protein
MNFPLIPKAEALALLEDASHAQEAMSEYLAERGSSYFYGGMQTPGDAEYMALHDWRQREEDFLNSAEGQEYTAKLDAALLYERLAIDCTLTEDFIPEFVDGKPSYAHSPFRLSLNRFQTSPDPDDIPF